MRLASLLLCALSLLAQSEFYPFAVDQDALGGAPDFSFLNHPLTAADAVFVRDGHFFRVGPMREAAPMNAVGSIIGCGQEAETGILGAIIPPLRGGSCCRNYGVDSCSRCLGF